VLYILIFQEVKNFTKALPYINTRGARYNIFELIYELNAEGLNLVMQRV